MNESNLNMQFPHGGDALQRDAHVIINGAEKSAPEDTSMETEEVGTTHPLSLFPVKGFPDTCIDTLTKIIVTPYADTAAKFAKAFNATLEGDVVTLTDGTKLMVVVFPYLEEGKEEPWSVEKHAMNRATAEAVADWLLPASKATPR